MNIIIRIWLVITCLALGLFYANTSIFNYEIIMDKAVQRVEQSMKEEQK